MKEREQVFDPLRKRYVVLTPEERVRQDFIRWLNNARGYPLSLMASEYSIQLGKKDYRCDIVCFSSNLQTFPVAAATPPHCGTRGGRTDLPVQHGVEGQVSGCNKQYRHICL